MSTTRGVRILVGSAVASSVILLGGCASSGTVSAGANGGSNPLAGGLASHTSAASGGTSTGGASSPDTSSSTGSSSSSDDSSTGGTTGGSAGGLGGDDPGCQAAMTDVSSGTKAMSNAASDPAGALAAIKGIGDKLHADAGKSAKPAAAAAINKVGDDYVTIAQKAGAGQQFDSSGVYNDAQAMVTACLG